jgi:hypothetical protein
MESKEIQKIARDIHFELILYKKLLRKLQQKASGSGVKHNVKHSKE